MLVAYVYVLYFLQVSTLDWVQAEKTYNLCEVLFKLHKVGILRTWDAFIKIGCAFGFKESIEIVTKRENLLYSSHFPILRVAILLFMMVGG